MATGIYKKHLKTCRSRAGGRCNCTPTWEAQAFDVRTGKRVTKTLPSEREAKVWRSEIVRAIRTGRQPTARDVPTVAAALDRLIERMASGAQLDRSGKAYKPSTVRSYRVASEKYLKPAIGRFKLTALRRADVQKFADDLRAGGLAAATIHCKLDPLRVVYRLALRDDVVTIDPLTSLELPRDRGRRDRIASPQDAEALLAALSDADRPLWAAAFYAGLRIGELRALRWDSVDFDAGLIRVERAWDDKEGEIDVKSHAGNRAVPLVGRLRAELVRHKLAGGRGADDLVFGRTPVDAFVRSTVRHRALRAWGAVNDATKAAAEAVGLEVAPADLLRPLTPHEARHTCASYLIAAGLNPKQLQTYIGHSDVRTTFNVYGHLMPGDEALAVTQLDAFLGVPESSSPRLVSS